MWHALICGASGGHTHPLIGNALSVMYGGVTHLTQVVGVVALLAWELWQHIYGDRGKGVPSSDEMMDIALVAVDFDDPTTSVRGRRALAIAKPTPRGY